MGESIIWGGDDPYTHMLVVGPTRCGKTALILQRIIFQLLMQKKWGKKLGMSIIEPKGDLARIAKAFCDAIGIPYIYIDPEDPNTDHFNVMEGNEDDVTEATVAVLQGLFGKQDAFFQTVQELSTRNITKLLKQLRGDNLDLMDVLQTLRDPNLLQQRVDELEQKAGQTDLVSFFKNELLGSMQEKYRQFVIGLRAQLENIVGNQYLRNIITGKSSINIDEHFANGGVLIVNTALGKLKKAGDAFGQFVMMHLQSGTFRRPGSEHTRIPHFLIGDEYSRYINPDVEIFMSIAASYRVAGIFAIQSLGQLKVESGKLDGEAIKQAIMTSCRNKIAFGGLSAADAQEFADEFGKDTVIMRQSTYKNRIIFPNFFPEKYRDTENEEYRFPYTYLQDGIEKFHYVARLLKDGQPQRPIEGVGQFIPRDWATRRVWERGMEGVVRPKINLIQHFMVWPHLGQKDDKLNPSYKPKHAKTQSEPESVLKREDAQMEGASAPLKDKVKEGLDRSPVAVAEKPVETRPTLTPGTVAKKVESHQVQEPKSPVAPKKEFSKAPLKIKSKFEKVYDKDNFWKS